jgi:phosphoribosylglycinamide formyltransferase-1
MTFPLDRPANLAIFASGRGSNMEALIRAFPPEDRLARVAMVMSDNAQAAALKRAAALGIASYHHPFPPRKHDPDGRARQAFEVAATEHLQRHNIDMICLAGFMRLFSAAFNAVWHGRMLNIHPSLLPDFKGLHPQRQALRAGVSESGCSVHFVDAGVDTGPVIVQRRVPVYPGDSEASLAARILPEEHIAYPEALRLVLTGQVSYDALVARASSCG